MKTFEEALDCVIVASKPSMPLEEQDVARITETVRRYREMTQEARTNQRVRGFVALRVLLVADGKEQPEDVMMSMFCCGLMVGVEMEKGETL